jgi:hypothetical protein
LLTLIVRAKPLTAKDAKENQFKEKQFDGNTEQLILFRSWLSLYLLYLGVRCSSRSPAGFRGYVGDFGTLLYAGHDWDDVKLARRSTQLMAEQVMPAVNKVLGGG